MKHAGATALQVLQPLLCSVRSLPGVTERKPGIFYVKSMAYLHFHEDPAGLFADIKLTSSGFSRYPVKTASEQQALLNAARTDRGAASPPIGASNAKRHDPQG